MYKTIYNDDESVNTVGFSVNLACEQMVTKLLDEYPEHSPRDIIGMLCTQSTMVASKRILKKRIVTRLELGSLWRSRKKPEETVMIVSVHHHTLEVNYSKQGNDWTEAEDEQQGSVTFEYLYERIEE
jgi:hypothetical protein